MPHRALLSTLVIVLACPVLARAQAFVGGGVSSFTPEIAVLNTGVKLDVQPTVSPDRRYVTLNMQPQNAQLLNLYQFQFQVGAPLATGFVGGVQFAPNSVATGAFGQVNPPLQLAGGNGAVILRQRGMTRIISP